MRSVRNLSQIRSDRTGIMGGMALAAFTADSATGPRSGMRSIVGQATSTA
jgi:hypothetical protein